MCVISFFVFLSRTCTEKCYVFLLSRMYPVQCSYPGRVRSVSDLARGLPRSAPLHARGRDFYIFCALFGDPVINRYLRDINVLRPLYFDRIVYLFIMVFLCFMPRVSVYMIKDLPLYFVVIDFYFYSPYLSWSFYFSVY